MNLGIHLFYWKMSIFFAYEIHQIYEYLFKEFEQNLSFI